MRKMSVRSVVAVMLLSSAAVAWGQAASATLEGTVSGAETEYLIGARVTAENLDTGWSRTAVVPETGRYRIVAIPPGRYAVSAALEGFRTERREGLVLHVGQAVTLNFELQVSPVAEEVIVVAPAPMVDLTNSEIGQVVEQDRVERLPLDGRDFLELAELAPGVAPSTGFGGGLTSISGFSFRNVTINVDGFESTDVVTRGLFGYFTSEPVAEFEVVTNRFSAEYGRSLSGVVNVITKSGTNDFHGTAYLYARDQALDAARWVFNSSTLDLEKEDDKDEYSQQQFGFSIGGPLARDRSHFFVNYERGNYDSTAVVTANPAWSIPELDISGEVGSFPQTTGDHQLFAKLTQTFSEDHRLDVGYSFRDSASENVFIGGFSTQSFGASTEFVEHMVYVKDSLTLSDRAYNDARVQYSQRRNDWVPNDTDPAVYMYTNFGLITCCGSHPSVDQDNLTRRVQIRDDLSWNLPRHDMRVGADVEFLVGEHDTRYTKRGYYVVWYGTPLYLVQAFGDSAYEFNEEGVGIYAQDDLRVSDRLTLNLGLRYDYNSYTPSDKDNIQPRLGFVYDPVGDGRTSLRGGVGLYHDLLFTQLLQTDRALGETGMFNLTFVPGTSLYPTDFSSVAQVPSGDVPARDIYAIADDLRTPSSLQASLGVSHELTEDLVVNLDAVYVRGRDLLRIRDINAPTCSGPFPQFFETAYANQCRPMVPGPNGFRRIDQFESTGSSEYKALLFNITKRMSDRYSIQASYTLADSKDDLGFGGDYVSRPANSNNPDADWGPSLNHLRHTFVLNGIADLPADFSVGTIFVAYSGRPNTALLGFDANGDGVNNDRPPGVGKNTLTGDSFSKVDVYVAKRFMFSDSYFLTLRLEAFNLFDTLNTAGYGNIVDTRTFEVPTSAFAPRSLQLSARFSF